MKARLLYAIVLILLFAETGFAGFIFTEQTEGDIQTVYVQKNRIKYVMGDHITIFDLNEDMLWLANPKEKTYWAGSPAEFLNEARLSIEKMEQMMEEQLAQLPPDQQNALKKALKNQSQNSVTQPVQVNITPTGEKSEMNGYQVEKIQIRFNGKLRQEQWIAKEIRISREIDIQKLKKFLGDFRTGFRDKNEPDIQSQPEVIDLLKNGWPLKRIDYDEDGYPEKVETLKTEKKKLTDADFQVSKNFRRISMTEVYGR